MTDDRRLTPEGAARVFELKARPDFVERLASLAGGTTWREPSSGQTTKVSPVPVPHQIAAALGFARRGPDDYGPDVALAIATGTDYRKEQTLMIAVKQCATGASGHELLDWVEAALWAWDVLVYGKGAAQPENKRRVIEALLWGAANDSVWRAQRAMKEPDSDAA